MGTAGAAARGLPVERLALLAPSAPPAAFLEWFAHSFGLAQGLAARMRAQIERREGVGLAEFEPAWLGTRVTQPVLVLHDEGDRVAPHAASVHLAASLPAGHLVSTRGLGHRRLLDDAQVSTGVLEHLQADGRGAAPMALPQR